MSKEIKVLDFGYVKHIESWGTGEVGQSYNKNPQSFEYHRDFEVGIIEAARQSTQGSFRGWENDKKLLSYLYNNSHSTPFEFSGMVIEVQAPIFVFREWHRHRTQSYNEMSARYSPLPDINYTPTKERCFLTQETNKQAQGTGKGELNDINCEMWLSNTVRVYEEFEKHYQLGLSIGIPKELARIILPVGRYSRMRASANLRNWLAFLTLRMAPNAQYEIRMFANAVGEIIKEEFPRTWELFKDKI